MARRIKAGSTDVSVVIRIIDSTDGTPETGVVYNTSGIDLQYRREGATSTAITEATLAGLDSAHSDGGFLHIGNGYYRLDLPDAAVASGASGVLIHGTVTGMVVIGEYVELVAYDPSDAVRLGLTALPNAAADAAGGLPISDAGGLDLDTLNTNVSAILSDTGMDGVVVSATSVRTAVGLASANLDTQLAALPTAAENADAVLDEALAGHATAGSLGKAVADIEADATAILADTAVIGAAGAGLTAVPWNASWDAEVQSEVADALAAYDPPTKAELDTGLDALPTAAENAAAVLTTAMTESYSTAGGTKTVAQALYEITQLLGEKAVNDVTLTVKKLDGSTSAMTFTLDDATAPTSITRAT